MAFMKIGTRYIKNREEWVEDFEAAYESDIQALPKANPGSTCHVLETNRTVKMADNGVWGGGSGGGGVTSWNDLEDKPFYSEVGLTELLPEMTVAFESAEMPLLAVVPLEVGQAYTVKWNGTEYPCTAQSMDMEGIPCAVLGDFGAMTGGDSTGEPFVLLAIPEEYAAGVGIAGMVMALDGSASATFSILYEGEVVHPLDNKFLDLAWLPTTEKGSTLMEETLLEFSAEGVASATLAAVPTGESPLIIFFDGKRYLCEPTTQDGGLIFGNGSLFQLIIAESNLMYFKASAGLHTVAVYDPSGAGTIYNKMPEGFLPGMAFKSGAAYGSARSLGAAEEGDTYRLGEYAVAEGENTKAAGVSAHAEGLDSVASGKHAHAEGYSTEATGDTSHAEGYDAVASADYSHAEGLSSQAKGRTSHAEGGFTVAASEYQHVQGRNNVEDAAGKYLHIVGNGKGYTSDTASNAHTLDWDGNAWFAGGIELTSPGSKRFRFTVDDSGNLTATEVTE